VYAWPTADSGRPIRGFTLIELLVVISITGLLIGILLPALGGTRDVATRVTCAANMRQLGAGVHLYANDQDDERARGPAVVHDFLAPFGALYSNTADSQVWVGGRSVPTGFGVVHAGYLSESLSLFCPGDDTTDPESELGNIGVPMVDAYGSYLYRNLDQVAGSTRLAMLGVNDGGFSAVTLALDRQTQMQAIANAYRTNHGNAISNLLFAAGHVTPHDNGGEEDLFVLRGNNLDFMVLPFRLDQIFRNADHMGHGRVAPFPFP